MTRANPRCDRPPSFDGSVRSVGVSYSAAGPVTRGRAPLGPGARRGVDETLSSLTLRQQVAQLVIQWLPGSYASTSSPEFQEWAGWVEDDEIGGLYLSIGLPHSYAAKINELQARSTVPLLVTSDFENGGPGMRINHSYALPSLLPQGGGTSFPPTMAFGAIGDERFAREYGRITAVEAKAVGLHLNFAPVLDVNSNPENPVINTRSFGEDPQTVARLGVAFIEGSHEGGILATAKHFPGHGDTQTDSHVALPVVPADPARLNSLELVPFRRAVDQGVDAVMTAHVVVSGVQGLEGAPATFDARFMTDLLRDDMGFEGLLLTDALVMGALSERYGTGEVAVLALDAGSDVLLMPSDVTEAIDAVMAAVGDGRLEPARIRVSARRVLETKARAGLHVGRMVDLDAVDDLVGTAEHLAFADTVATRSITLLRDRDAVLPVDPLWTTSVLSLTYARPDNLIAASVFDPALAGMVEVVSRVRVGPDTPPDVYDSLRVLASEVDLVIVSAYTPPRSGTGDVSVSEAMADFITAVGPERPMMVISFGNPYLLAALPESPGYLIAWGAHEVSQNAAVRALFGQAAIGGRLPVSIPPYHQIGDGLTRTALPDPVDAAPFWAVVDPETVGMDADRLREIDALVAEAIADSASPGAVLAIARHGRFVRLRGYGKLDWAESARSADPRSIYDVASLTKVVGTTTAAMLLVDEGRLDLDAPVVDYLPWWAAGDPAKERVTVRHLLLHRAGLPPFRTFFLEMEGRDAYMGAIAGLELDYEPGTQTVYSDIGFMTLAFIIERVSGQGLDEFLASGVWDRLGMGDTGFRPAATLKNRIAPTEVDEVFRNMHVHGVVHDENAYAMGGVAGHAGLFSTASDLALLAQTLLDGGDLAGCEPRAAGDGGDAERICAVGVTGSYRLVTEETVRLFTERFDSQASRALGWDTSSDRSSAGDYFTRGAFGHTGFTGTSIWIDPELDMFVVLLTNRVNPTRNNDKHVPLRRAIHDGAALAITDRGVPLRGG
ncbi:MAG: glycoside hydrolase family 3 N-terminal domain-containing protein [Longimicrobiales bacterium]